MTELLNAYRREGDIVKTVPKDELMAEIKKHSMTYGDAPYAIDAVWLMLVHPEKGLYIVQRDNKEENPNLFCKTVGGHIMHNESSESALERETSDEISVGIKMAGSVEAFISLTRELNLNNVAIVRKLDYRPWVGTLRLCKNRTFWKKRSNAHIFLGSYSGDLMFNDGEAINYEFFETENLRELISGGDPRFSHDLGYIVKNFHTFF